MDIGENGPKIDVGIITIKQEEFSAVIRHLGKFGGSNELIRPKHNYIYQSIATSNGLKYNVAVARCLEQGTGIAQSLAADMVEELNPAWLFLVGIAGGVPAPEYSLGDVMLCTRLHDFSRCSISEGDLPKFAPSGGPMHFSVMKLLEILPGFEVYLDACGWNSQETLSTDKPKIDLSQISSLLTGSDDSWKKNVTASLIRNFSETRKPRYYLGPIGSSDNLVKSPSFLKRWLDSVRDLTHIDMELAGVYHVAQKSSTPLLSIRGLSDIVGYSRSPEWTQFACESAASFAICIIENGFLALGSVNSKVIDQGKSLKNLSDEKQTVQDCPILSLPDISPFHPAGEISSDDKSYIQRESDKQLKMLLSSHSFIFVQGDFESGKSSLLGSIPRILPKEWKSFRPKIEFFPTKDVDSFEKEIFKQLKKIDGTLRDWTSVHEFVRESKLAFLIDEIGILSNEVAAMFITRLHAIVMYASSDHVRVVITSTQSVSTLIEGIGLPNPKYSNCWAPIRLTPFTKEELIELLELFPLPVALSLQENLHVIEEITSMRPKEVQLLCDHLWERLRDRTIPIREIDHEVECNLKEYRKV